MQTDKQTDHLVVVATDGGYRVYSPLKPAEQYVVQDTGEDIACSCAEFAQNRDNPEYRCRHISAVMAEQGHGQSRQTAPAHANGAQSQASPERRMLLRRSVSPDGRINSFSIEVTSSAGTSEEDAVREAEVVMRVQTAIAAIFSQQNGGQSGQNGNGTPVPAQMLDIGGMNGRWGRRLFINVQVNGQKSKLFGTEKQLGDAIQAAGFPELAGNITEGRVLNLPCQVTTKPNGKYTNIEQVMPAGNGGSHG